MEIQRLFIKDTIEQERITLIFCRSEDMLADVLTKAMSGALFKRLIIYKIRSRKGRILVRPVTFRI